MLRSLHAPSRARRVRAYFPMFCLLVASMLATSCGGGGGVAAKEMVLLEFLLVDRELTPVAPTGSGNLPRNAQVLMVFSEQVNPGSVDNQSIQFRTGPSFQSVPTGSFSVTGNIVRFDPTLTSDGQPNPFGFDPVAQYIVQIPSFDEQDDVLENLDRDPNLASFYSTFTTSDGYLRELIPPEIVGVGFVPDPEALTGNIPAGGLMYFDFSEAMDPASFESGLVGGPTGDTTVDIRYTDSPINDAAGLVEFGVGIPVTGSFSNDAAARRYFFRPTFSFGDQKFTFTAQVFQGLRDLSGNALVNPASFGPYTVDGRGRAPGKVMQEDFTDPATPDRDAAVSDADWGGSEEGVLKGLPVSSRNVYLFGYEFTDDHGQHADSGIGQYAAMVDPLVGADLNQLVPGIVPATALGRRTLWSYNDTEIGESGAITEAQWGPDSNATYAARYENVVLRMGFQVADSVALGTNFEGNYEGTPTVVYNGPYSVMQAANIGNTPGHPIRPHVTGYTTNMGCNNANPPANNVQFDWNLPLFDATGFYPWPTLTTFFEWDAGAPGVDNDQVFLFDASVTEGDGTQQMRGWFASTFPCSGIPLGGFPGRRLYATYEEGDANPETDIGNGILNPEPTIMDMCFTVTKRTSIGQSLFYTDPTNPVQAAGGNTFGALSDYLPAEILPRVQSGGTQVVLEFQGASLIEADRRTINMAAPFTAWTQSIDDCDGMPNIRYRCSLISNLISLEVARVTQIRIPVVRD